MPAAKPDNLSSIPGSCKIEGEGQLPQDVFWLPLMHHGMCTHRERHIRMSTHVCARTLSLKHTHTRIIDVTQLPKWPFFIYTQVGGQMQSSIENCFLLKMKSFPTILLKGQTCLDTSLLHFMGVWFTCISMNHIHCGATESISRHKTAPPELELQRIVSHHMVAGSQTQVPCKNGVLNC